MKIIKKSTTYDVEHNGRSIYVYVSHEFSETHFEEDKVVMLPSGNLVTDKHRLLKLSYSVGESDIETVLADALGESGG